MNTTKPSPEMNRSIERIDRWNGRLLVFLASGAFILSYAAMYSLAKDAGIPVLLTWLWPLVTEAGVVIFSLALLRARLHGYDSRSLYYLILICTGLSVIFNVSHAPADLLNRAVFALPPIFLLIAFKTLLWQIEQDSRREALVTSLADLAGERERVTADLHELRTKVAGERESLAAELDTLTGQRDRLSSELAALREQVTQAQQQVKQAVQPVKIKQVSTRSSRSSGQVKGDGPEQVRQLKDGEGLTWPQVAERLGASESSVKRWYRLVEPAASGHSNGVEN